MRSHILSSLTVVLTVTLMGACNGTTGDLLVTFPVFASGVPGAGDPFSFNGKDPSTSYTIQLTYAHMYVGAIYVDEAPASSGGTFNTPACISQGVYCAQVPAGLDIDLLSTEQQPFPVQGSGSADEGLSWEIYLAQGDVNNPSNTGFGVPNTVDLQGTATRQSDGVAFSWAASVTINASNRGSPSQQAGQPGLNPICKQRILELANIDLTLAPGDSMLLTIDPRGWFKLPIDFSALPSAESGQCQGNQNSVYGNATYCIPDSSNLSGGVVGSQQGQTLFKGIFTAGDAAYALTYLSPGS